MNIRYLAAIACLFIYKNIEAQVPVLEEPHHKPVLVNDYVRLLDVHINPGDTTLYHIHASPSVIVEISKAMIGLQKLGEAPSQPSEALPGNIGFSHFETNPVTHRVFNAGDNVFHVMDIELVKKEPAADSAIVMASNFETVVNEKLVRVYKFTVDANQNINIYKSNCAHLLVCIDGSVTIGDKELHTGDYAFYNPGTSIPLINNSNNNSLMVLLELK